MSTTHEAYKPEAASEVAVTKLPPTHPIRLGLALLSRHVQTRPIAFGLHILK